MHFVARYILTVNMSEQERPSIVGTVQVHTVYLRPSTWQEDHSNSYSYVRVWMYGSSCVCNHDDCSQQEKVFLSMSLAHSRDTLMIIDRRAERMAIINCSLGHFLQLPPKDLFTRSFIDEVLRGKAGRRWRTRQKAKSRTKQTVSLYKVYVLCMFTPVQWNDAGVTIEAAAALNNFLPFDVDNSFT